METDFLTRVRDARDHVVMALVTTAWVAATVYLFKFHSDTNFMTWGTFSGAIISVYHWITVRDDKTKDAQ